MADAAHLAILRQGVDAWNHWYDPSIEPDLSGANLSGLDLSGAYLNSANLSGADLSGSHVADGYLMSADLHGTNLRGANLTRANLAEARLSYANLSNADIFAANLHRAVLTDADLSAADLTRANLYRANLCRADLRQSVLRGADLSRADLSEADLSGTLMVRTVFVETTIDKSILTGANVYGISVWDLRGTPGNQRDLVVTRRGEPAVTVDDLNLAQFVHLLLSKPNIRNVIDTIGAKGVLILGRFGDRKPILDKLRVRLRELGFAPMVFDFEKPASKDFTETVRTLAGMSAFIVADITKPKAVPQEAQAIIPDYMVPFVPIIEAGEEPWSMFQDLWVKHRDWVFEPLVYPSIDQLIPKLGSAVVAPALERRKVLLARRAEEMGIRSLDEFELDEG